MFWPFGTAALADADAMHSGDSDFMLFDNDKMFASINYGCLKPERTSYLGLIHFIRFSKSDKLKPQNLSIQEEYDRAK